jgi:hypothetical protein
VGSGRLLPGRGGLVALRGGRLHCRRVLAFADFFDEQSEVGGGDVHVVELLGRDLEQPLHGGDASHLDQLVDVLVQLDVLQEALHRPLLVFPLGSILRRCHRSHISTCA